MSTEEQTPRTAGSGEVERELDDLFAKACNLAYAAGAFPARPDNQADFDALCERGATARREFRRHLRAALRADTPAPSGEERERLARMCEGEFLEMMVAMSDGAVSRTGTYARDLRRIAEIVRGERVSNEGGNDG